MPYLLRDAILITLDPPRVEQENLRVEGELITERGAQLEPRAGDEVIYLNGKLVMPGMVCAHTHLYSALARGMPAPPRAPQNFREILELVWWRLDRALDQETIYWSAMAGAMDAARAGTTCLFDHHASPSHIKGSLQIVRKAIERVGLRAVLCYEVTDRGGSRKRNEGLDENRAFLDWVSRSSNKQGEESKVGLFRAMAGAHASFTLSNESLDGLARLMRQFEAGIHIHAAEDFCDVEDARSKYGIGVVERLAKHGALNNKTILAHGIHLDDQSIEIAREAGAWFAHNPRSNMNNQVGYAPVEKFGERVLLGTDGIGSDMFDESRFAFFKGRDNGARFGADYWAHVLANNQRIASEMFAIKLGALSPGAAADLVVLDYDSPTPITAENLAWHFAFGLSSASVEGVMVNGRFIIRDRQSAFDHLYEEARRASKKLWDKLREL
ncbi:MAG TPA: putative aminohydrolase SsnA [Blastocatellia bacterium]|nr:putative aminohydrolase SsnA [Blastocatellia bacterium]